LVRPHPNADKAALWKYIGQLEVKVDNQRIEIRNLADLIDRANGRCVELDGQVRTIQKAVKKTIYG
jgi:hypothetical protein